MEKVIKRLTVSAVAAVTILAGLGVAGCDSGSSQETPRVDNTYIDMSGMGEDAALQEYGYYVIDKDGDDHYSVGDLIKFGSYPYSVVEDEATLAALNEGVEKPTSSDFKGWTSYGFYDGGEQADYAFYRDVESGGEKYRAVYLTKYRGMDSSSSASTIGSGQHGGAQALNEVYWYKYETLTWRILSYSENVAYLTCLDIVDYMPYRATESADGSDNDWASSDIRAWLNDGFLTRAFTSAQAAIICETTLDNETTCYKEAYGAGHGSTTDKIFLMSYKDMINTDYGFPTRTAFTIQADLGEESLNDASIEIVAQSLYRRRGATDYSLSLATEYSTMCLSELGNFASMYAARSAGNKTNVVTSVNKYGNLEYTELKTTTVTGVVPALNIRIGKTDQS